MCSITILFFVSLSSWGAIWKSSLVFDVVLNYPRLNCLKEATSKKHAQLHEIPTAVRWFPSLLPKECPSCCPAPGCTWRRQKAGWYSTWYLLCTSAHFVSFNLASCTWVGDFSGDPWDWVATLWSGTGPQRSWQPCRWRKRKELWPISWRYVSILPPVARNLTL